MEKWQVNIIVSSGVVFLLLAAFYNPSREPSGLVETSNTDEHSNVLYETKVKNPAWQPIRLCGGQLNWCGPGGCYKVITDMPTEIPARGELSVTVSVSPSGDELQETELTLYADGAGLPGLVPIKIKLPAKSLKRL